MRLAFTHNLQLAQGEEEAEFDRPETIQAIAVALERLGHEVELIEVSGPASRVVARLEALNPNLVFNTAEGRVGRFREGFYPGLFEQLGLPYSGSDAYVCSITLDKQLTKMLVAAHGVPTPRWEFIDDIRLFTLPELTYPVIVKPNFEGSSKGITQDSVVDHPSNLLEKVRELLLQYPTGVIIEEFIPGKDITVPFLEKAAPKTGGVLCGAEFLFAPSLLEGRRYNIYDFALKTLNFRDVTVKAPADMTIDQAEELTRLSRKILDLLGVRDLATLDYRLTPDGRLYFLELNALPNLAPGSSIYASAQTVGLKEVEMVLDMVIRSAADRQGIDLAKTRAKARRRQLRVGLTYNLKRIVPKSVDDDDSEAEYDSWSTIESVGKAIESHGHEVVYLEATPELPAIIAASQVDFVFNIAEGVQGRNRESSVPAMLELLGIPYTGSDPATLSITLDKALSKKVLMQAGIRTPAFCVMRTGKERLPKDLVFPVIIKPVAEGSSKGVLSSSVLENEEGLREAVTGMLAKYRQPVLVEEFLSGREFTLGLLGESRPKVLPPMEIVYTNPETKYPIYTFEHKLSEHPEIKYEAPAKIDAKLQKELERVARNAFIALGCRDVARIDLRLGANGKVYFIECNPLPGLTPDWSDMCLVANAMGMNYRTLIGEIMAPAINRWRDKYKQGNGSSGLKV
jgi:D-alanine-D-alanine ligase